MRQLEPTDGFVMQAWMVTHLHLTGYELMAYAIVRQFSQSNAGVFWGGISYMAAWLGCADNTARKYLRSLEAKGLITAIRGDNNGVPFCHYAAVKSAIPQILKDTPQDLKGDTSKQVSPTLQNLKVENNIDNNKKIKEGSRAFRAPSLVEVREYCKERGNEVDADAFVNFYDSKGWKVGNAPMKDWRAAVRTWERRGGEKQPATKKLRKMSREEFETMMMR